MIDNILGAGSNFDWLSPLAATLDDAFRGSSHTFLILYDSSPLSGREIQWMLSKRGVKCWGLQIVGGTLMVSVKLGKAQYAQHLLEQAGVPVENPPPAQKRAPKRERRSGGVFGVFDIFEW